MIMLKATGDLDGRPTIMLGLSRGNLNRFLTEMGDSYIHIRREEMGIKWDIIIFSGESEAALAESIKRGVTSDTIVHVEPKKR
jgi:hypothetical protein